MSDLPRLRIPLDDLRDIWATLNPNKENKCRKGDLITALGDPEMQALLTLTSKFGPTKEGEEAVEILTTIPEQTVRKLRESASVDSTGPVVKSNEVMAHRASCVPTHVGTAQMPSRVK